MTMTADLCVLPDESRSALRWLAKSTSFPASKECDNIQEVYGNLQ
jgi:hypothetical protein